MPVVLLKAHNEHKNDSPGYKDIAYQTKTNFINLCELKLYFSENESLRPAACNLRYRYTNCDSSTMFKNYRQNIINISVLNSYTARIKYAESYIRSQTKPVPLVYKNR